MENVRKSNERWAMKEVPLFVSQAVYLLAEACNSFGVLSDGNEQSLMLKQGHGKGKVVKPQDVMLLCGCELSSSTFGTASQVGQGEWQGWCLSLLQERITM